MNFEERNLWRERFKSGKEWLKPFAKVCSDYLETNTSLHIVLEDGNLRDRDIQWCQGYALGRNDILGNSIANLLEHLNMKQRKQLYKEIWKDASLP